MRKKGMPRFLILKRGILFFAYWLKPLKVYSPKKAIILKINVISEIKSASNCFDLKS